MNKTPSFEWLWSSFQDLTVHQLYQLLKLRQDVFIIEQDCIYPDIDDQDPDCLHLLGYNNGQLVAYLRLIPAEYHPSGNIALGRIIAVSEKRGAGLGTQMMHQALEYSAKHFSEQNVQMSAQLHLKAFYERFNFECISEPYDEDGIMHIDMLLQ